MKSYKLDLKIDPPNKSLSGSVTMTARAVAPGGLGEVALDLADNMSVTSVRGDGHDLQFTRRSDQVSIKLARRYQPGAVFELVVNYQGQPKGPGFSFREHQSVPMIASYGLPNSARRWWPCKDTPTDKADSVELVITVPAALVVASNGKLSGVRANDDGTKTFFWSVGYPIYPDTVSLAITNYQIFTLPYRYDAKGAMTMTFYVFPEDMAKAQTDFSVLPDMMASHVARFGPYPFLREKYGIAEFALQSFREHQTLPSYGAAFITGDHKNDSVLAHELAHQWFGNLISVKSWSHIWLNEGFATYAYALWREHRGGQSDYLAAMRELDGSFEGSLYVEDPTATNKLFSNTTFNKGAWVLHMLRRVMGEQAFFNALKRYVKTFAYKNADTEDFQAVCEREYGRSLGWFFKQWVYGVGRPEYKYQWQESSVGKGRGIRLTVEQTQAGTDPFQMPLDVAITTATGVHKVVIRDEAKSQSFNLPVAGRVQQVQLDPDGWVLKKVLP